MPYEGLQGRRVLIVDDDQSMADFLEQSLSAVGCSVATASSLLDARKRIADEDPPFDIAAVDLYIPTETEGRVVGILAGKQLALHIRRTNPGTLIVGISAYLTRHELGDLEGLFDGFLGKTALRIGEMPTALYETLEAQLESGGTRRRVFVSHGRAPHLLNELRVELSKLLPSAEVVVLSELGGNSMPLIDSFESEVGRVDVAFVLLTPDDKCKDADGRDVELARQNVILELGYFFGKLGRQTGSVIILKHEQAEIPSNIAGLRYIDITGGIGAAREEIRGALIRLALV